MKEERINVESKELDKMLSQVETEVQDQMSEDNKKRQRQSINHGNTPPVQVGSVASTPVSTQQTKLNRPQIPTTSNSFMHPLHLNGASANG